jgi:hypothetical protein
MAAVELAPIPAKVYWTTAPQSMMAKFGAMLRELGEDVPDGEDGENGTGQPPIGLPDDEISTWVDTRAFARQKFDALGAHASQNDNIFFLRLGLERFTEFMGVETFSRVHDSTGAPLPEDDLFAGLRL